MISLRTFLPLLPNYSSLRCAVAPPALLNLLTFPLLLDLRPHWAPPTPRRKLAVFANESVSQAPPTPAMAVMSTSAVSDSASTPTRSPGWPARRLRCKTCGASIRICARNGVFFAGLGSRQVSGRGAGALSHFPLTRSL